jgi:hypothetical protein
VNRARASRHPLGRLAASKQVLRIDGSVNDVITLALCIIFIRHQINCPSAARAAD